MSAWIPRRRRAARGGLVTALTVSQDGANLTVAFTLRDGVAALALWAWRSDVQRWSRLTSFADGPTYRATIDLALLAAGPATAAPDGDDNPTATGATVRLYAELRRDVTAGGPLAERLGSRATAVTERDGGLLAVDYRSPLGNAQRTVVGELVTATCAGRILTPYLSRTGVVSVALDRELTTAARIYVGAVYGRADVTSLRGRVNSMHTSLVRAELELRGRTSGAVATVPIRLDLDRDRGERRRGQHWYRFRTRIDWNDLLRRGDLVDDTYDARAALYPAGGGEPHSVRVGETRFLARALTRPSWAIAGGRAASITPYYTFKARKTSFLVDTFDRDTVRYLRRALRWRHLARLVHRGRPIWLVGERPDRASDTGLAMFAFLRREHPEIDARYVIERSSPDYATVAALGNVVEHGSREHIRLSLLAKRVLASHSPDLLYPVRTPRFRHAVNAVKIFIQHGVMGTKWMVPNYGKGQGSFEADRFIVSSRHEKSYIVRDFGFEPREVAVTGLSRFDELFAEDTPVRRQLLVIPTWRDWLQTSENYLDSEYHLSWSGLLGGERFRDFVKANDLEVVLRLHPNMTQFADHYCDLPGVRVSTDGTSVQHLMKQSAAMLTDYSSVGFDFAFLDRPVVYFQFDRGRFLGRRGSHIDVDAELPGVITLTEADAVDALAKLAAEGFAMPDQLRARADRFIDHRDSHNCERIFDVANRARAARLTPRGLLTEPLVMKAYELWRRNRSYFPTMRLLLRLLRLFPADGNLVVFESWVGRRYADGPRYIYEELVRRDSALRKVWVYRGTIHAADEYTRIVKRFSPAYFWYLGRAHYWVNNQSFPNYVRRRRGGVFVQTWHGTPLKRMLHDLGSVYGRTEGYLRRATTSAAQWSVLCSPSSSATEAMRSAFDYRGRVIEVGYPRNDVLVGPGRDQLAAALRRRLRIPVGARVILYAPTFRDDQSIGNGRFGFTLPLDLERLHGRLGPDTYLLLRLHTLISGRVRIPEQCRERIRDVSRYPEAQELLLISDALITDYSSVLFDYACLRRPIVFYAPDLVDYRERLRGFYLDYEATMPGPVVTSEAELVSCLDNLDEVRTKYAHEFDAFLRRFAPHDDGHATERVVDAVFGGHVVGNGAPRRS